MNPEDAILPHREVFDKPVVRFELTRAHFPRVCPVCGKKATKTLKLTLFPGRRRYLNAMWNPRYMSIRGRTQSTTADSSMARTLMIPVCEDHEYSYEDFCRLRFVCVIGIGITMAMAWVAVFKIGGDLWKGRFELGWAPAILVLFGFVLVLSWLSFRPSAVERAIKIIGFDPSLQNIIVDFKNASYRERFLEENPGVSEPVKWIIRA